MPAGDVFGLDGFFLNVSNPITVSTVDINSTDAGAGIAITGGSFSSGTVTLTFSTAAGLSTTPFYTGAKIAVSGLSAAGTAYTGYNGNFVVTGFAGTTTVSYATTGYVGVVTAGISTTGLVMLVTDTQVTNTTWSSAQTHGWFGGGNGGPSAPGIVSTVDRIDFSNDTATANIRGPLSGVKRNFAATGNSNYGWFGGAGTPGPIFYSTIDRINFSNDSSTASVRSQLSTLRYYVAATGNSNYGWFGGGAPAPGTGASTVDRIDFSNDSGTASSRGLLSLARFATAATGNSNYGWFGAGGAPGIVSTVDRIDFSNDSATAVARGPLSLARAYPSATGNSNYGWFGGGLTPTAPVIRSIVDRIDFSNDTSRVLVRGPLSQAKYNSSATGNSNYGWFGGGNPSLVIDRIDFSNDSATASLRSSTLKYAAAATSGQARSSSVRLQKGGNFGWFGGGVSPGPIAVTVDRIDFSNDSATASPRGPLSLARYAPAATGNSNYGWFGGGATDFATPKTVVATVDRIDFSNDSATASVRGTLSTTKFNAVATGNSNYGWFGGGERPSLPVVYVATVDRIDFSNDSATASVRGPLSVARYDLAATGNSNYGWFASGFPAPTRLVDRIDFSNDSVGASVRGLLGVGRVQLTATANSNYGWFGGGNTLGTVDRIDFSNDSATASVRGPLNVARYVLAATGNSNYGWFGGGVDFATPATVATVDRIDFSNDSVTASTRGPLSLLRYSSGATSNTPVG